MLGRNETFVYYSNYLAVFLFKRTGSFIGAGTTMEWRNGGVLSWIENDSIPQADKLHRLLQGIITPLEAPQ